MASARILIVEDEAVVAKDIAASLAGLGYAVLGALATGEDAVAAAAAQRPDLILMDIMLKGTIDGIEAAARVRRSLDIPIVFLTAYTDEDTLFRAKATDAFGYLLKPFEDRELRTTIEMALYKHTMERRLRESREWLETTLRCIGDAVIATDADGRIQFMNPMAETLTGWPRAEAAGRRLADVFCLTRGNAAVLAEPEVADILQHGKAPAANGRALLVSREGRQVPVAHSTAPIRDAQGRILGVVVSVRDVAAQQAAETRERRLQERLARSQRADSLGRLAGGVANRLNNILGPLADYPDLVARRLPADSAARQDLRIIRNSACKALELVRDLLTLGRIGHGPLEPLALNPLVRRTLASPAVQTLLRQAPLVALHQNLAEPLPPVRGSERLLLELVRNLLIHAVDRMPAGGPLTVTTAAERVAVPREGHEIVPPGAYVVLGVRDGGPPMAEADLSRLFDPFTAPPADQPKGSGLELAVVYAIAKEHQGFVDARTRADAGVEVDIWLPLAEPLPGSGAAPADLVEVRGHETVLVVDDDDEQRQTAARWLRTLGYHVLSAAGSSEALALVETRRRNQEAEADLALIDLILGDAAQDGLDLFRDLLAGNPRQKAILTSGFAVTDRVREALRAGVGQHLQKPYGFEDLGRAVRRELDKT